jgi:hypothetical protein
MASANNNNNQVAIVDEGGLSSASRIAQQQQPNTFTEQEFQYLLALFRTGSRPQNKKYWTNFSSLEEFILDTRRRMLTVCSTRTLAGGSAISSISSTVVAIVGENEPSTSTGVEDEARMRTWLNCVAPSCV